MQLHSEQAGEQGLGCALLRASGRSGHQWTGPLAPPAAYSPSLSRFQPGDKHRELLTTWRGVDAEIPRNAFTDSMFYFKWAGARHGT